MRVSVVGGTGFIGSATVDRLLREGAEVDVLARRATPPVWSADLPAPRSLDISRARHEDLVEVFRGSEAVLFAAGADDRVAPKRPAREFFLQANVRSTAAVLAAAREAGVRQVTVVGSYLSLFAHAWPELRLADRHPYVRSRVEQQDCATEWTSGELAVCVVPLPFVFGAGPLPLTMWRPLVRYIASPLPLACPSGGSSITSIDATAACLAIALTTRRSGVEVVPFVDLKWTAVFESLAALAGRARRATVLDGAVRAGGRVMKAFYGLGGREAGLDPTSLQHLSSANLWMGGLPALPVIADVAVDGEGALRDTVELSLGRVRAPAA